MAISTTSQLGLVLMSSKTSPGEKNTLISRWKLPIVALGPDARVVDSAGS